MPSSIFVRLIFASVLAICVQLAVSQLDNLHPASYGNVASTLSATPASQPTLHSATPNQANQANRDSRPAINQTQRNQAVLTMAVSGLTAFLVCFFIIRFEHLHAHFSHDHTDSGPQKFHAQPTPRIGGVALAAGLLSTGLMVFLTDSPDIEPYGMLLFAAIPAFAGGLLEDITKRVGVLERLLMTMISASLAAWLIGAVLTQMNIPLLREALTWPLFAVIFTVFAVGGVVNAINIIDGSNGLAPGYAFITLMAIALIAAQVGDAHILIATLAMAGALLGFFFWNWPAGKIFLGDGGAYLLGFWMAELCVLLVVRNPELPARLFLALMVYPVFETLFTIYRRQWLQKQHPGLPDNQHLHQLVYKTRAKFLPTTSDPAELTRRNSAVAPYFWVITTLFAALTLYYRQSPSGLVFVILSFCIAYVWAYFHLLNKTKV